MLSIDNPACKWVYKAVRVKNNKYYSMFDCGKYRLEYGFNQVTKCIPGTIGIFVYDNLYQAEELSCIYKDATILRCLGINLRRGADFAYSYNENYLDKFYKYNIHKTVGDYDNFYLTDELLPVEIVTSKYGLL